MGQFSRVSRSEKRAGSNQRRPVVQRVRLDHRYAYLFAQPGQPGAVQLQPYGWRLRADPAHQESGGPRAKYSNAAIYKWQIAITGYFSIDTADTNNFPRREHQFLDTLRWTHGKHQITFGGDYSRGYNDAINNFRANGQWAFGGTSLFTNDGLADFLIGRFNTLTQGIGEYKNTRETHLGMFFQDSIKLTRRFTMDAGMRWEPFFPFTDDNGKLAVWSPGQKSTRYLNAPVGVLYVGDPGVADSGIPPTYHNFAPRLGFAWDVMGDGKTSVRGGYGIFYDYPNSISTNSQADQAPFGTVLTTNGTLDEQLQRSLCGHDQSVPGIAESTVERDLPAVLHAVRLCRRLPQSVRPILESDGRAAVDGGLRGPGILCRIEGNSPGGAARTESGGHRSRARPPANTNQRRVFAPAMGSTPILESVGNSTYHALQTTIERRYQKGPDGPGEFPVLAKPSTILRRTSKTAMSAPIPPTNGSTKAWRISIGSTFST